MQIAPFALQERIPTCLVALGTVVFDMMQKELAADAVVGSVVLSLAGNTVVRFNIDPDGDVDEMAQTVMALLYVEAIAVVRRKRSRSPGVKWAYAIDIESAEGKYNLTANYREGGLREGEQTQLLSRMRRGVPQEWFGMPVNDVRSPVRPDGEVRREHPI